MRALAANPGVSPASYPTESVVCLKLAYGLDDGGLVLVSLEGKGAKVVATPVRSMRLPEPGSGDLLAGQFDARFQGPAARLGALTAEQLRIPSGPLLVVQAEVVATNDTEAEVPVDEPGVAAGRVETARRFNLPTNATIDVPSTNGTTSRDPHRSSRPAAPAQTPLVDPPRRVTRLVDDRQHQHA
jgi:hypothetical protein